MYFTESSRYFFVQRFDGSFQESLKWCHDIQHDDTQHNDTQHKNNSQHNTTPSSFILANVIYAECYGAN